MTTDRQTTLTLTIVTAVTILLVLAITAATPKPTEKEAYIHVLTHTVDDREIRCIYFSEYGLSCDWTHGDRLGINP